MARWRARKVRFISKKEPVPKCVREELQRARYWLPLLICYPVELAENPAPRALLTGRPARNRKSDLQPSARIENREWHGPPLRRLVQNLPVGAPQPLPL